jgi:predicted RNA-binding Zn-ribbon protein involved in translation (DUF1610 family)
MNDYEIDEFSCPKCSRTSIHWRRCNQCDDGYIECDDAINYTFGENSTVVKPAWGRQGIESWCPSCGVNVQSLLLRSESEVS